MKILLVDDEEQVLKGVSRLISCEQDDWEVETAMSGELALERLEEASFDVVVSDMRMPGMDGAQLLDEVEKLYPSMLRIILSGQADRETVLRAVKPMHQYLSKPCDPDKLLEAISQACIFQETIHTSEILDAIGSANCLPSFPEIVNDINREVESETCDSKKIADIVSKDPVLSARLLQLANSAIFSLRSPVADIDRAVSMVGVDMIRSLAMCQAVYNGTEASDRILSAQSLLDHGYTVAMAGRQLARHQKFSMDDCNVVFAAGLLHDVGKLILLNAFPEKYKQVMDESKTSEKSISDLEIEMFRANHQGVGAYLFGLWGLPSDLVTSVAAHHSFEVCAKATGQPCQLVFAANWIVNGNETEDLLPMVESAENEEEARAFVEKIVQWAEYLEMVEEE